jgi:stress response protein SCP2
MPEQQKQFEISHNKTNKSNNVKIMLFTQNMSKLRHVSIYLDNLQGATEHQNLSKLRHVSIYLDNLQGATEHKKT